MQRFAMLLALLLASLASTVAGQASGDAFTAVRLLSDDVVIENSDETNETVTEEPETTEEPTPAKGGKGDDEDNVIVGGSLEIATEDPQAFCDDSSAQTALRTAVATAAQAESSDVNMRCRVARRLSEASPDRRLAGSVIIEYTVTTTSALVDYLEYLDEEAWTQAINQALADAGSDLSITVVRITQPAVQDSAELPDAPEDELSDSAACGLAFPAVTLASLVLAAFAK